MTAPLNVISPQTAVKQLAAAGIVVSERSAPCS